MNYFTDDDERPSKQQLKKRLIQVLIILALVFGLVFLFDVVRDLLLKHYFAHFALPTAEISTTTAKAETWAPTIPAIGNLVAIQGVNVSPQVAGMVTDILFQSGQMVKKGQPLVQLDDRADKQDLANFSAQLKLSQLNYQRQLNLVKTNATAQSSLDQASAQLQENQAIAAKTQVLIDQKLIKAPFDGKLGIRNVNIGQYVSPGNGLVNLQEINPLLLQFSLPEQNIKSLYSGQIIHFTVDNFPGQTFTATLHAIESQVNTQTHNILIEATVPNDKNQLLPGMFANVEVLLPTQENVVSVPQTAISSSLYGDSVFVVHDKGKDDKGQPVYIVERRYVTTGNRRDNEVAVVNNLKAGETVVISGQLKLDDGVRVIINNSLVLPPIPEQQLQQNQS